MLFVVYTGHSTQSLVPRHFAARVSFTIASSETEGTTTYACESSTVHDYEVAKRGHAFDFDFDFPFVWKKSNAFLVQTQSSKKCASK
jgi:hypothetical protein